MGKKETGKIIGHDDGRICSERLEQAAACSGRWLHVGVIVNPVLCTSTRIVRHAVENKAMEAVISPWVATAKRFEDDKRFAERTAVLEGAVKSKIEGETPARDHPVQDVIARGAHRPGMAIANTNRRNRRQRILPRKWREAGGNV